MGTAPIGIFGGTFDPVHNGHLRPVLEVLEELELAQVRLIPVHVPAHRPLPAAGGDHRLDLLRLAVDGIPGFEVDTRELDRGGPSYMVDTLRSLRREFPRTPLCLILGMDSFLGLPSWRHWHELIELAHLVVMDRPGSEPPLEGELAQWLIPRRTDSPERLRSELAGRVYFHAVTRLDISATRIRALLAAGRAPHFLLPPVVWRFIADQGLYGWSGPKS
jgi:nicotinate-nucleotide adenylyltransferase